MSSIQLSKAERKQIVSVLSELKNEGLIYGRRHRRQPVRQFMWLKRLPRPSNPRGASFKIVSEDASLQGLGFVTRRRLYVNELVVVPLQFKEGGGMAIIELSAGGHGRLWCLLPPIVLRRMADNVQMHVRVSRCQTVWWI